MHIGGSVGQWVAVVDVLYVLYGVKVCNRSRPVANHYLVWY